MPDFTSDIQIKCTKCGLVFCLYTTIITNKKYNIYNNYPGHLRKLLHMSYSWTNVLDFWQHDITANDCIQWIHHFSNTYISLVWVPSLPLDAFHHVYIRILGIDSACVGYPMEVFGGLLVPVPNSSPHPFAPLCLCLSVYLCVRCGCLCVGSALPCYMLGSQDVSIDRLPTAQSPPPHPPPTPAVPTATSTINITLSDRERVIFVYGWFFT